MTIEAALVVAKPAVKELIKKGAELCLERYQEYQNTRVSMMFEHVGEELNFHEFIRPTSISRRIFDEY